MLTDQEIDEFLEMLAKSPTSARDMVRGLFAAHEAKAAPAVPHAQYVKPDQIAAVKTLEHLGYTYHGAELWKPPLGQPSQEPALHIGACITYGVLHATVMRREANGHVTILATAEMDAKSLLEHDCVAKLSPAAPSQPVTLTESEIIGVFIKEFGNDVIYRVYENDLRAGLAIIAALREKEQTK